MIAVASAVYGHRQHHIHKSPHHHSRQVGLMMLGKDCFVGAAWRAD